MNTIRNALLTTLITLGCGSALAADSPEASIAFINQNSSIRDWQADGQQGLWIEDSRKQWYYAKLAIQCIGLDFAVSLGFETRTTSSLDRFGYILVPGHDRCAINSLVKSDPPPEGKKKRSKADAPKADAPAPAGAPAPATAK